MPTCTNGSKSPEHFIVDCLINLTRVKPEHRNKILQMLNKDLFYYTECGTSQLKIILFRLLFGSKIEHMEEP
jgi:hypothetical protein